MAAAMLITPLVCTAQTYSMPAGTTTTCSGTFYDPGGTSNYTDPGPSQTWVSTFASGSSQAMQVSFSSFNIESTGDWLYVYDGPTTASPLIGAYTGFQNPFTVTSSGSSITFQFVVNGNGWAFSGWAASLSCLATQTSNNFMLLNTSPQVSVPCGGTSDFYDRGGPSYNYYPAVATYITTYAATAGQHLQFTFDLFNTESYGDWLYVYDGSSTSAPLIGMYSGNPGTPFSITSTGNTLTFRFVDDGDGSNGAGWHASVTCTSSQNGNTYSMGTSSSNVPVPCGVTSMFYDFGGPSMNYYSPGTAQTYTTTYSVPAGQKIAFNFSYFFSESNGDWLNVYDGPTTASPRVAQLTGAYNSPFNICSSGNTITFEFVVNANGSVGAGWAASVTCTAAQTATLFTLGNSSQQMPVPCGVPSKLYDLGGPGSNYIVTGSAQSYVTTFVATVGQYIQLNFNTLATEYANDRLNIYDGSSTSAPLIGQYTGFQSTPLVVTSTSNTMTLEFIENGNAASNIGWDADITCISAPGPSVFTLANSALPTMVSCTGTGSFYDTGGASGNYVDNAASTSVTTYQSLTAQVMQFTFNTFGTGVNDILYVYDGSSTTDPLIASYTGFPSTPFTVTSTTNYITFRWVTNGSANNIGWAASINCIGTPLPIELLHFDAVPENEKVDVEWITATETNNDYFTVERSIDGLTFEPVGVVDGAGNSVNIRNYTFIDHAPYPGTSYYRLKQTDFNGGFTYSNIRAVNLPGMDIVQVFPNPAADMVTFLLGSTERVDINIRIYDKLGRIVMQDAKHIENDLTQYSVDISSYPAGVYTICVAANDRALFTQKQFVK